MSDILCFYHKSCTDGFGAALAVREWLKEKGRLDNAEFIAAQYGDEQPNVADYINRDVIIVDFSFLRHVLVKMESFAKSIVVIDHHKTAEAELAGLDFCVFDMNQSGAVLTWKHLFPDTPPPKFFLFIQDRDLWRWELPDSKAVSAGLRSHKMEFETWERFLTQHGLDELREEGKAILRYQQQQIEMSLAREIEKIEIGGYTVPCVNCTHLISEIGNELAQNQPFAALYFDTGDGKRVFSLRSTNEGVDVSEVARQYGGGGHRNAAGFTIDRPEILPGVRDD